MKIPRGEALAIRKGAVYKVGIDKIDIVEFNPGEMHIGKISLCHQGISDMPPLEFAIPDGSLCKGTVQDIPDVVEFNVCNNGRFKSASPDPTFAGLKLYHMYVCKCILVNVDGNPLAIEPEIPVIKYLFHIVQKDNPCRNI